VGGDVVEHDVQVALGILPGHAPHEGQEVGRCCRARLVILVVALRPSDSSLTGRIWNLVAYTEVEPAFQGVVPHEQQLRCTIAFETDGTFAASADCNQVVGTYEARGNDGLTITPADPSGRAWPRAPFGRRAGGGIASGQLTRSHPRPESLSSAQPGGSRGGVPWGRGD